MNSDTKKKHTEKSRCLIFAPNSNVENANLATLTRELGERYMARIYIESNR